MQYTTRSLSHHAARGLFYHDFKDTFVCNTQPVFSRIPFLLCCFIMISKILLYAIHNFNFFAGYKVALFYQDFKDTFVCNTQPFIISSLMLCVVLSWFQRYFCMQYTTSFALDEKVERLFYQDVNEQFCCKSTEKIGNMQIYEKYFVIKQKSTTFAPTNLKDIHNKDYSVV